MAKILKRWMTNKNYSFNKLDKNKRYNFMISPRYSGLTKYYKIMEERKKRNEQR